MSSDYGITSDGYIRPDFATILGELMAEAIDYFGPNVDLTPGSPIYILLTLMAFRKNEIEMIAEQFFNALAISTSYGRLLDMHGEDVGLKRKSGTKATVTLTFTGDPGTTIPAGTTVSTNEGYSFETIAESSIPSVIEMMRGSGTSDQFPSIYSGIDSIEWISLSKQGLVPYTEGADYNFIPSLGVIDWSPAGDEPLEGVTYYVKINSSYSVDVSARAVSDGSEYNVPANTITILNDAIAGISSVTNDSAVTNGTDEESDDAYKKRLLNAPRRNWTLSKIASVVDATDGVRASSTRWDHGIDTYQLVENEETTNPPELGQIINVSDLINNISKVTFKIKRFGKPGYLEAKLYRWRINYATSVAGPVIAETLVPQSKIPTTDFNEIDFELVATNVDSTYDYLVVISQAPSADATNFYQFKYATGIAGSANMFESGNRVPGTALYHKVWYHSASFTSTIAPETTYDDALVASLERNIDSSGRAVGIQRKLREADKVVIQVFMEVLLDEGFTLEQVEDGIKDKIQSYVNSLNIEEDVRIAEIISSAMAEPGVLNVKNVRMSANDVLSDVGEDITIYEDEIAILGDPGIYITEIYE
ncbi:MAG: baseplate J/gp47 family protein [Candidatus Helarchaeales archaeon]